MKISWSQLHNLPVQTESGQSLGLVEGVTIDVDVHVIKHYEIKPAKILSALFAKTFLIAPEQVVSITTELMTVQDSAAPVEATINKKTRLTLATAEAKMKMRED